MLHAFLSQIMAYLCCSPDRVSSESSDLLKVSRGHVFVDHIPLCFMSEILNPIDNIKEEISKDSASFCKKIVQEINQDILQNKYHFIDYNTIELRFIPKSNEELRFDFEYIRKSRRSIVPFHRLKFQTHFVKDDLNQRTNQINQNPISEKEAATSGEEGRDNGTNDNKIDAKSGDSVEYSSKKVVQTCETSDQHERDECNNSRNLYNSGRNEFEQDVKMSIEKEQNSNNEGSLSSSENHKKISEEFIKTDERIASKKKHFRPKKIVRKMLKKSNKNASNANVKHCETPKNICDEILNTLEEQIPEKVSVTETVKFPNVEKKNIKSKKMKGKNSNIAGCTFTTHGNLNEVPGKKLKDSSNENVSSQSKTTENLVSVNLNFENEVSVKKKHFRPKKMVKKMLRGLSDKNLESNIKTDNVFNGNPAPESPCEASIDTSNIIHNQDCMDEKTNTINADLPKQDSIENKCLQFSRPESPCEASIDTSNIIHNQDCMDEKTNTINADLPKQDSIENKCLQFSRQSKLSTVSQSSKFNKDVPFQKRYYYSFRGEFHSYKNALGIYGALESEADILRYIRRDIMFILRSHFSDPRFY